MRCFNGWYRYSFQSEDTEILSTQRKAKVDRLNLVFVILKLVLVAGKLDVYVFVYLLIVSAFTLTSRCWKHVQDLCGV